MVQSTAKNAVEKHQLEKLITSKGDDDKEKGGRGERGVTYSWQHIVSYLLTQKLLQINIKVFVLCASPLLGVVSTVD